MCIGVHELFVDTNQRGFEQERCVTGAMDVVGALILVSVLFVVCVFGICVAVECIAQNCTWRY
jgi:hypothetical protein